MKTVGIICECNPFHEGHRHLVTQAKRDNDAVVCVMSGYFTQRGEVAIADPYARAEALIAGGADLVLELPFPYSCAGAESFASAGISILSRFGADELWFGSECGDLSRLRTAAEIAQSEAFLASYTKTAADSAGTAQAFFKLLQASCPEGEQFGSNDALAIAYLCALNRQNSSMRPVTVKREGAAYLEETLAAEGFPSATALRRLLSEGLDRAAPHLLPETYEALKDAAQNGTFPAALSFAERAILHTLRLAEPSSLDSIAELGGGLGNRLIDAACRATTLEELLELAATKKYPLSRIRRGILFAMTGTEKHALTVPPAYTRILASNERGRLLLAEKRRSCAIPLLARQAELPPEEAAAEQEGLHRRMLSLYTLCLRSAAPAHALLRKNPTILK
jgi:predicted nucleotidyltransferase